MTKDRQIDKMAQTICNVCYAHHSCHKEDVCVMAYVAAEGLYNDDWRKQITAKWEIIAQYGGLHVRCSNADCHRHLPFGASPSQFQYCPFCGAKMEGECR